MTHQMKLNWEPIDTHPHDEPILCAVIHDGGQNLQLIGTFVWSTDEKWADRWSARKKGLWLAAGGVGCDACWREQHPFTHWAPVPISRAEYLRQALLEIRGLPTDAGVAAAKTIARSAMERDADLGEVE